MKTRFRIITAIILLFLLTNCKKNDLTPTTGLLVLAFSDPSIVNKIQIRLENDSLIYYTETSRAISLDLNPANYYISWAYTANTRNIHVQIRAGHTTRIFYNYGENSTEVRYE